MGNRGQRQGNSRSCETLRSQRWRRPQLLRTRRFPKDEIPSSQKRPEHRAKYRIPIRPNVNSDPLAWTYGQRKPDLKSEARLSRAGPRVTIKILRYYEGGNPMIHFLAEKFQAGGPIMWPILACSALGIAIIFERMRTIRAASNIKKDELLN